MAAFLGELLPGAGLAKKQFLADFIFTTIASLAEEVSSLTRAEREVKRWAATCADMILSFLGRQEQG